jgi:hypothetical protein
VNSPNQLTEAISSGLRPNLFASAPKISAPTQRMPVVASSRNEATPRLTPKSF